MKSKKANKFMQWIIRQRLRSHRGKSWFANMDVLFGMVGVVRSGLIGMIVWYGGFRLFTWGIGYIDEKFIKSWQYQNKYNSKNLNPVIHDMHERIKKIESKL